MLPTIEIIVGIFGGIIAIILTVSGAVASYSYFKQVKESGAYRASNDSVAVIQTEVDILKEKTKRLEDESKVKDDRISRLNGKVEVLERENRELKETLALRNPEFEKTLKLLADAMPKVIERVEKVNLDANARYDCILKALDAKIVNTHTVTDTKTTKGV